MIDQGTIHRDELQPFHMTLREQKSVERIARAWLGIEAMQDVRDLNIQDLKATRPDVGWHIRQRHTDLQLTEPAFDCNFPKRCDADEPSEFTEAEVIANSRVLELEIAPQEGEKNMSIQQQTRH